MNLKYAIPIFRHWWKDVAHENMETAIALLGVSRRAIIRYSRGGQPRHDVCRRLFNQLYNIVFIIVENGEASLLSKPRNVRVTVVDLDVKDNSGKPYIRKWDANEM